MAKPKLELTWIGKDARPRLEPRILIEEPEFSHHAPVRRAGDIFDNLLIHGDNLLALKALETDPNLRGKVKCIFIDPPYNTGSAFEHYDDGLEHSLWLGMMRDRLELLRNLLAEDGSIWITIDDNEAHYLKVLCDEVFGRTNFAANVIWQKVYSERMDAAGFSNSHDHILVFGKSSSFSPIPVSKDQDAGQFGFLDEKTGKYYRRRSLRKEGSESLRKDRPSMWYPIEMPDGSFLYPVKPDGTEGRWRWKAENVTKDADQLEFVQKSDGWHVYVKQYIDAEASRPPATFWPNTEAGHNHEAKLEVRAFNSENVFSTPKPERLIQRVLEIATNPGDLVLDSFAGSGTTGAVAHKMGRRWIMVELGEHAKTHIVPRLRKVIDGTDKGGITDAAGWKGGGGFRFARLAPSLLERDAWGNWVVSKEYNGPMLAEAMCKHFNYTFAPSLDTYWIHGHASDAAYIYVTTSSITVAQARAISDEVGENRSLLICCMAYESAAENLPNITMRKIPRVVLDACEWGRDDYSLKISALPMMEDAPDAPPAPKGKAKAADTPDLFGEEA